MNYEPMKLILLQEQLYHLLSLEKEQVQFGWIMCSVLDLNQNYYNVLTMVSVITIVFI